jgi:hypothetical protein
MPKTEIDYSNTIIYKITCRDTNITDVYVGHTINFIQRKNAHKATCLNEKSVNYKCKLYEAIRCNGGWSNWKMEIINFFNCVNHYEARTKEQEYFILLHANLNSIEPLSKPKSKSNINVQHILEKTDKLQIYCEICNVYLKNNNLLEIHNNTKKHIKMCNIPISLNNPSKLYKFECNFCDYICCKQSDYIKHTMTIKHSKMTLEYNKNTSYNDYFCECGKKYAYHSGLWKHKKTCQGIIESTIQKFKEKTETKESPTNEIIEMMKAQVVENQYHDEAI